MKTELIEFKTKDGLALPGLLYKSKNSKKAAIYLHGNGSSSVFYDEGKHHELAKELNKKGISLLKFNNRGAHIIKKLNVDTNRGEERIKYGCAYEIIKECALDINGALNYLKKIGYKDFYLIGASTGANKICVYDHYSPKNIFRKYVLLSGGDDTGIYYDILGHTKFFQLLEKAKRKIKDGKGDEIFQDILDIEIFSYKAFYDVANPDGDYNCFPYSEIIKNIKLSKKRVFRYFKEIKKESLVVYGSEDEYAWGDIERIVGILEDIKPEFKYKIIKGADHGFKGKRKILATVVANWL